MKMVSAPVCRGAVADARSKQGRLLCDRYMACAEQFFDKGRALYVVARGAQRCGSPWALHKTCSPGVLASHTRKKDVQVEYAYKSRESKICALNV